MKALIVANAGLVTTVTRCVNPLLMGWGFGLMAVPATLMMLPVPLVTSTKSPATAGMELGVTVRVLPTQVTLTENTADAAAGEASDTGKTAIALAKMEMRKRFIRFLFNGVRGLFRVSPGRLDS